MNKIFKWLPLILAVSLTLVFLIPNTAYASPGTTSYQISPTNHSVSGGWSYNGGGKDVKNVANAYDGNNATCTTIKYDAIVGPGSFAVISFDISGTSGLILSVDFKMRYSAGSSGQNDEYRILYNVSSSANVVLQPWTSTGCTLNTRVWSAQSEPNDGTWDWTDVSNICFVVQGKKVGGGGGDFFEEYEAWVTVNAYTYTTGTIFVDPPSLTDPSSPFTVDIEVSSVEDLYGWEFKLYYDNTILSNSSVTEGAFLSSVGSTYFSVLNNTDTYNATHGRFWVTCTLLGHTAGKTGSGVLATISFTVDGPGGTTPLSLADTKLVGYIYSANTLIQMSHLTADGQVTISAVPEFPFGAALEIALVGVIVYVWWRKRKQSRKLLGKANVSLTHCACMQNLVI